MRINIGERERIPSESRNIIRAARRSRSLVASPWRCCNSCGGSLLNVGMLNPSATTPGALSRELDLEGSGGEALT